MFKQILVPLDGSKLAELSLPYAEALASAFDSRVTLLFVCDTPQCSQHHEHQMYVAKTAGSVRDHIKGRGLKTPVKPVMLEGHPATEIVSYATENDISLIIMATHGCSGLICWALGTTADKVIDRASTPVLLIRATATPIKVSHGQLFQRILLPLDGSETGEAALPYIKALTEKIESEVVLFQVIAPGRHVHTIGGLDYVRFDGHLLEAAKARATEYLDQAAAKLSGTKATVKTEVRSGDTAEEIIKFADETGASVVAMSSHGHSGIERWAMGSVTHRILHHDNTPLLLVRSSAAKSQPD